MKIKPIAMSWVGKLRPTHREIVLKLEAENRELRRLLRQLKNSPIIDQLLESDRANPTRFLY